MSQGDRERSRYCLKNVVRCVARMSRCRGVSRKIVRVHKASYSHVDLDQRCDITTGSHRTGGSVVPFTPRDRRHTSGPPLHQRAARLPTPCMTQCFSRTTNFHQPGPHPGDTHTQSAYTTIYTTDTCLLGRVSAGWAAGRAVCEPAGIYSFPPLASPFLAIFITAAGRALRGTRRTTVRHGSGLKTAGSKE